MKENSNEPNRPEHERGKRLNDPPAKTGGEKPSVLTKDGEHAHPLDRAHARHPDRKGLGQHGRED